MLKNVLFLISRDLLHLLQRRETLLWTFVMPVIFFYFIGNIIGGPGPSSAPDPIAVVAPENAGFLVAALETRVEQRHFRVNHDPNFFQLIRVPDGFTDSILAGKPAKIEFIRHGSNINADYEQIRIRRATFAFENDIATLKRRGIVPTPASMADLANAPKVIALEVSSAGARKMPPIGFEQAVPGMLVMFTMLVLLNAGGSTLLTERRLGILRRLASAPMSRATVMLGKWGARVSLGFVQIAVAMATGALLFHVHWGEHLGAIAAVLAAYAGMIALVGMLLGNAARSEGQVIGFGVVVSNVLAALGGCWWPIEITPPWAQKAALFLPTGWAMDALHRLMSFGDSPAAVLPHIAGFLALALLAGLVLTRQFRFE